MADIIFHYTFKMSFLSLYMHTPFNRLGFSGKLVNANYRLILKAMPCHIPTFPAPVFETVISWETISKYEHLCRYWNSQNTLSLPITLYIPSCKKACTYFETFEYNVIASSIKSHQNRTYKV